MNIDIYDIYVNNEWYGTVDVKLEASMDDVRKHAMKLLPHLHEFKNVRYEFVRRITND